MCSDDFDPVDIWNVVVRRARKAHRCDECHRGIFPGESYALATWLADGSWNGSKRCSPCYFLCEAIETLICGDHGTILWGAQCLIEELHELGVRHIEEHADDDPSGEFAWAGELFRAIESRRAVTS